MCALTQKQLWTHANFIMQLGLQFTDMLLFPWQGDTFFVCRNIQKSTSLPAPSCSLNGTVQKKTPVNSGCLVQWSPSQVAAPLSLGSVDNRQSSLPAKVLPFFRCRPLVKEGGLEITLFASQSPELKSESSQQSLC